MAGKRESGGSAILMAERGEVSVQAVGSWGVIIGIGYGLEICQCVYLPLGLIDVRVWVKREALSILMVAKEDYQSCLSILDYDIERAFVFPGVKDKAGREQVGCKQ